MESNIFKGSALDLINLNQEFLFTMKKAFKLAIEMDHALASNSLTELKAEVYASKSKLLLQTVNEIIFELAKAGKEINYQEFSSLAEKLNEFCKTFDSLNPMFNATMRDNKISETSHYLSLINYSYERSDAMKHGNRMNRALWFDLLETMLTLSPTCTSTTLVRAQNRLEILAENHDVRNKLLLQVLCSQSLLSQQLFTTLMADEFNLAEVADVIPMLEDIGEETAIKEIESYLAIDKADGLDINYYIIKEIMKNHFFNYLHNGTLNGSFGTVITHKYNLK